MGNRLSKIYTRTGDEGTTGLGDGQRVPKESLRIDTCGAVDELNSMLGLLLATEDLPANITTCLTRVQNQLLNLGGELCIPDTSVMTHDSITELEAAIDQFNATLPPLKDFILPGGTPEASTCHLARTICRRAERRAWQLAGTTAVNEFSLKYLNRLSDLLFVIARTLNSHAGHDEPLWQRD